MDQKVVNRNPDDKSKPVAEDKVNILKAASSSNTGKFLYLLLALAFVVSIILGWQVWVLGKKKESILEKEETASNIPTPITTQLPEDKSLKQLESFTGSDEIDSIETDLNNTDLGKMDKELELIEREITSED